MCSDNDMMICMYNILYAMSQGQEGQYRSDAGPGELPVEVPDDVDARVLRRELETARSKEVETAKNKHKEGETAIADTPAEVRGVQG